MLHGRPHGFKWRPIYSVTVEFESAEEAQEFFESLHEGGIVTSNAAVSRPREGATEQAPADPRSA